MSFASSLNNTVIEDYKTFLRFPSISSDARYKQAVKECAEWLSSYLKKIGLTQTAVYPTALHPIVYSELTLHPSYTTILFYGHYDVQPAGPGGEWRSHPFQPMVRDGIMYARGAADDKGPIFLHLKAIEHVLKNRIHFRVNIKCIFEGEEEIGSPNLSAFIRANKEKVKCNVAVISDTKMKSDNVPAITYSLRGSLNAEIYLQNAKKELHAGTFGGMIENPAGILARIIAGIQDANGRILLPGFYDSVYQPGIYERAFMKQQGPSDESLLSSAEVAAAQREEGYSLYEQTTIRPAIVISGISAGHTGAGVKNIVPARATATINMRLVNEQQPALIARSFAMHIRKNVPPQFQCKVRFSAMSHPVEITRTHPYMDAAARAYAVNFPFPPVFLRSGGTIPVVSLLTQELGIPVILMGFGLASDNMHAANEKFSLQTMNRGIRTSIAFMKNLSTFSTIPYGLNNN